MPEAQKEDVVMGESMHGEDPVAPVDASEFRDPEKIIVLPGASEDGTAASFQIKNEDHTLGNSLRYMIMKNPDVEFCGYSIPHPSEAKLNIRIQTYGDITAVQALHKGLNDLVDMCDHVADVFRDRMTRDDYTQIDE